MKRIVVIILVICTLLFSGCAVLQEMKEGTKEAMTLSNEFCSALSEGDIDAAKGRYDGSVYSFTYNAVIGGKSTYMFFTIVKNDNGYGIYNFGIEQ